eukprot:495547_1
MIQCSNVNSCKDSRIHCPTDQGCIVDCSYYNGCYQTEIYWKLPDVSNSSIICANDSCSSVTSVILCSKDCGPCPFANHTTCRLRCDRNCDNSKLYCNSGPNCIISCGSFGCLSSQMEISATNASITCSGTNSCNGMVVISLNSDNLEIRCHSKSCTNINIYCGHNCALYCYSYSIEKCSDITLHCGNGNCNLVCGSSGSCKNAAIDATFANFICTGVGCSNIDAILSKSPIQYPSFSPIVPIPTNDPTTLFPSKPLPTTLNSIYHPTNNPSISLLVTNNFSISEQISIPTHCPEYCFCLTTVYFWVGGGVVSAFIIMTTIWTNIKYHYQLKANEN